jgi:hypothetical protein
MSGRSWSEDFTVYAEAPMPRPHNLAGRSWSHCEDYSYHPPLNTIFNEQNASYDIFDDVTVDPYIDFPQATTMAEKCGYRTGKCFNMRALKRNGKFHKLCDFHRGKANLNQKRLDHKKRLRRVSPRESPQPDESHSSNSDDASSNKEQPLMNLSANHDACPTRIDEAPLDLRLDELEFFCNVMTTKKLRKHNELKLEPIQENCRSEIDLSVELDILMSEAMLLVNRM